MSSSINLFAFSIFFSDSPFLIIITSLNISNNSSKSTFRGICHYLHAIIAYEASFNPLSSIDPRIDLTESFFDQGQ